MVAGIVVVELESGCPFQDRHPQLVVGVVGIAVVGEVAVG